MFTDSFDLGLLLPTCFRFQTNTRCYFQILIYRIGFCIASPVTPSPPSLGHWPCPGGPREPAAFGAPRADGGEGWSAVPGEGGAANTGSSAHARYRA